MKLSPDGWKAIETSSIENFYSKRIYGCPGTERSILPLSYTTCFSYTCTKVLGGDNTIASVNHFRNYCLIRQNDKSFHLFVVYSFATPVANSAYEKNYKNHHSSYCFNQR